MDIQPPSELCQELDLDSLNNYRIAIQADRLECVIEVNDKDNQIKQFNELTSHTYRLTKMIEKGGTKVLFDKLYWGKKISDLELLLVNGVQFDSKVNRVLLGEFISKGDLHLVDLIINRNPDFNWGYSSLRLGEKEPLIETIKTDQFELAKRLLDLGYPPNATDHDDNTPLIWAVFQDKMEFVELLLEYGANVNWSNFKKGLNPLSLATHSKNKIDLTKYLLEHGADPNHHIDHDENTPLSYAIRTDDYEIINLLIDSGGNLDPSYVILNTSDVEMVRYLINRLNYSVEDIRKLFINAAHYLKLDILDFLFQTGHIDQDTLDSSISAPFDRLWVEDKPLMKEIINKLLFFGVNINGGKDNPLIKAHNPKMIKFLISKGADPNASDHFGRTSLYFAVEYNYFQSAKLLIEAGADVNMVGGLGDLNKHTPLYKAVSKQYVNMVKLLLNAGADPNLFYKGIPLTASNNKDEIIMKMLIENGANVNYQSQNDRLLHRYNLSNKLNIGGQSVLMYYVIENPDLVHGLLEAGADPNLQDNNGNTVLHYIVAEKDGYSKYRKRTAYYHYIDTDIIKLLLQYGASPNISNTEGYTPSDLTESDKIIYLFDSYK